MSASENSIISSLSKIKNPPGSQTSKNSKRSRSSVNIVLDGSSSIPQKDSDPDREKLITPSETKHVEGSGPCQCGPDLYSRVLGPTADETILTGLQTVIDLCNKLRVCGDKEESGDEEPERDSIISDMPERDTFPSTMIQTDNKDSRSSKIQTDGKPIKSSVSQTNRNMVSAGFQVNPIMKSKEAQTAPYPQMVSEILQTIGISPEVASKVIQTSFISLKEPVPKKTSLTSILMQTSNASLKSGAMQTTNPSLVSGLAQTSGTFLLSPPPPPPIATAPSVSIHDSEKEESMTFTRPLATSSGTQSEKVKTSSMETMTEQTPAHETSSRMTMTDPTPVRSASARSILKPPSDSDLKSGIQQAITADEHKCISPPEPPKKSCKCCSCSSSNLRKSSTESKKKICACHKRKSKCRCSSSATVSSSGGDKESPLEVKYALTRISKFKEFTTFEVMKSTKNEPKRMPKNVEGVFVLRKNKLKEIEKEKEKSKNGHRQSITSR